MTTKTIRSKDAAQARKAAPAPRADSKPKAAPESAASARLRKEARAAVAANLAQIEGGPGGENGTAAQNHNEQGGQQPAEQRPEVDEKTPPAGGGKPSKPEQKPVGPKGQRTPKAKPVKSVTAPKPPKVKKLSCIDAAAMVIGKDPIGCKDLIAEMGVRKLWSSPNGKTPDASLYAAIIREISAKGTEARFRKVDRGLFVASSAAKKGA